MNKKDAQDYRSAAELIASGMNDFCCHAIEFDSDSLYPGVGREDLVEPFKAMFGPSETQSHFIFWNHEEDADSLTKTDSPKHSRECRIFALLLMAEMIENP